MQLIYTIPNLIEDREYDFRVFAINEAGLISEPAVGSNPVLVKDPNGETKALSTRQQYSKGASLNFSMVVKLHHLLKDNQVYTVHKRTANFEISLGSLELQDIVVLSHKVQPCSY